MRIIPAIYTGSGQLVKTAVNGFLQRTVTIPLSQEDGSRCTCLVNRGDVVSEGQVIAEPASEKYGAKIHASVPGIVEDIVSCTCPDGTQEDAVKIRLSGAFSFLGKKLRAEDWQTFPPRIIVQKIADAGIVNTFKTAAPVSLAMQLDSVKTRGNRLLVVRLYDDDPWRMTDSILSSAFADDVRTGALITARAFDADGIVFACDAKSPVPEKDETIRLPLCFVQIDIAQYPSGFKEEIMLAVKEAAKEAPFIDISEESIFTDATTMLSVCNAVKYGVPAIEQYVYVSGECIPAIAFIKVRTGTTMEYLAMQCGGFEKTPAAVVVNGFMLGSAVGNLDTPITKYVKSISFISRSHVPHQRQLPCMRCGCCRVVCPRNLSPDILYRSAAGGAKTSKAYVRSSLLCIDCGLCNSVCPSRLPICQAVKLLQKEV
ncbi:MAG: 4Fe-4S dicluster domain-containing protein [Treponema sp.]|nr:4Fe-4S dicluster domain-containing protein [Treponema sp.]